MYVCENPIIGCFCVDAEPPPPPHEMQQVQLGLAKELFFNVLFFQIQDIVHTFGAQSRIQLVSTFPIRVCGGCVICDHSSILLPK